jgi:16S rRNA (adenine1518-N6/adenine1519-N6)-dimethyltransferase
VTTHFSVADKQSRTRGSRGGIRRQLATLGHRPRRSLGQNFLADPGVARKIVALANIKPPEHVIEIGPGLGALTDLLAQSSDDLCLIEYDRKLAADLRTRFADAGHIRIVEADVLEVDWPAILGNRRAVVVANLPYNIATAVLTRLLEQRHLFSRFVVMVQREVAERLVAAPGSKAYGVLGILTQAVARVRRGFRVAPGSFVPRPEVESEVVVIEPSAALRAPIDDLSVFRRLVRTVFSQRRKQLVNSMRPLCDNPGDLLSSLGIDPRRRPETLTLDELAVVSNALGRQAN